MNEILEDSERLAKLAAILPGMAFQLRMHRDGRFTFPFASDAIRPLFGLSPQDVRADGCRLFQAIHPDDRPLFVQSLQDSARSLAPWNRQFRVLQPDGSILHLEGYARPERLDDGSTLWHGYHADITDRIRAAEQLRLARENAHHATRNQSEFLGHISHEIRTPMTTILGYSHLLAAGHPTPSEQSQWSRNLRHNSEALLSFLSDVLDISRIEAGQIDLHPQPFSPWELLQNVAAAMRPQAEEKKLELEITRFGRTPELIHADADRLKQILLNLVSNAIKFTDQGSVNVEMSSEPSTRHTPASASSPSRHDLIFTVSDTGMGIDPDKIQHIFQPFARVQDANAIEPRPGTGLGLAIASQFARIMGGCLSVESVPGQGSRFTVRIDAGNSSALRFIDDTDPAPAAQIESSETIAPSALTGVRILVAEDNPDNQRIIKFILEQAGASIELASHGDQVTQRILHGDDSAPIHLIVMDMQMPVCDGYAAARVLRSHDVTIPIIALTACTMPGDRHNCLNAGCNAYLAKPVSPETLVRQALRLVPHAGSNASLARVWAQNAMPPLHPRQQSALHSNKTLSAMLSNPRYARLVKEYVAGLEETRALILQHLQNADLDALRVLAHRLKGSGSSYGFPEITHAGAACEAAIKNAASMAEIQLLTGALIVQIDKTRETPGL